MTFRFDQPELLWLGFLAVPLLALGVRALRSMDALRRGIALALRTLVLLALVAMLAGPKLVREHDHLTVIGLLDISGSVQRFANLPRLDPEEDGVAARSNIDYLRRWFREATRMRAPDDRFGLVVFDGTAIAISAPVTGNYVDDNLDVPIVEGTNIADAVRLGLAMFPADTAKRLVLVSDGNETAGSVAEAVKHAAGGAAVELDSTAAAALRVPIDVLPIAYSVTNDVQVVRVETPPAAQPGQTVTVRMILEATSPTAGRLSLRREGQPVDLNGAEPGTARSLVVPAGQSVHLAQATLGQTPVNRFVAAFEASDAGSDMLPDNDRAESFTATPSRGTVLVVDSESPARESVLVQTLRDAGIPVESIAPAVFPSELLSLQNYDLIVLNNVAAYELNEPQQALISEYVRNLGGGLIMVGGENSFGAGGWNGSAVEELLPVELDPPKELRLASAALVLVLDKSGSMQRPVSGARASQQTVANEGAALAIESLRNDSLVGVVAFDMMTQVIVPLAPNEHPKETAQRVREISAHGGTNMVPALRRAYDMLKDVEVAQKRVICLSDGQSASTDFEAVVQMMKGANIQLTTIAVGDDADHETMKRLAEDGGGEFYAVHDPRTLPRVLLDSVQIINKPLIKAVPFVPKILHTGSSLTAGMDASPQLGGLVITAPREDARVSLEMIDPDGEPLLAHWQIGLGRVAAFTSSVDGHWSEQWVDWPGASTFWTQLTRTTARPPMNRDAELLASIRDDQLDIALEAATSEGGFDGYLQVEGSVYLPSGRAVPVRLRQTAPGRYETSLPASEAGNYIVALNPRRGSRQLSPVIGGANRSTSPEFRRYTSNIAVLDQVAELTHGRRLDVADPRAANLFDRTGMPRSTSALPVWRTILLWSLALLLLDVACRRIAWDYAMIRAFAARAVAKVKPAHVRGAEAATTLAGLRRISTEVETRQDADAAGITKFQVTGRVAPPPDRTDSLTAQPPPAQAARVPDAARVNAALDALLGRDRGGSRAGPEDATRPTEPEPQQSQTDATETTRSLLEAKRRARRRVDGESP